MFEKCTEVRQWLSEFDGEWMFAGGWAIDLHIGEETRHHDDVEVAIFREKQHELYQVLKSWDLQVVKQKELKRWEGEPLTLPVHEIHAFSQEGHRFEILLNEKNRHRWQFRRDSSITFEINRMHLQSEHGHPYLNPEIVLLYKSTHTTDKDEEDFQNVFPFLNDHQKEWLKQGLMHHQPEHPWLEALLY
ncbi:nucleotidyltransferase domain-containing protein [Halobacillus faecis]